MSTKNTKFVSETPIFFSRLVVDNRGDVWKEIDDGYIHRMYNLFIDYHPKHIKPNDKVYNRIIAEDIKRLSRGWKHNYRCLKMY
tara:strand:+ start:712 stop:963 length:252 start_codon:yes stop_codon:yes gene_type:complete